MSFLTEEIAERALEIAKPFVEKLMEGGVVKRNDLFIVIGEKTPEQEHTVHYEDAATMQFGDKAEWDFPFDRIARAKARISARTGLSSRVVQLNRPELLENGDVAYWGSVISGNIVVAASGVEPYWDEAISKHVLAIIIALIEAKRLESISESFYQVA